MAVQCILILAGLAFQFLCQTPTILGASLFHDDCCMDELDVNGTCPVNTPCRPGCYRHHFENGTTCLQCKSLILLYNVTECSNMNSNETYLWTNTSTAAAPPQPTIGGPAVAASLLLGTLFISLFLILSVASFFYLKRSSKLPDVFYRRNKASILQPSETAVMIPTPTSSVRKPRYVRRERPSVISTSATMSSATTTRVSNV